MSAAAQARSVMATAQCDHSCTAGAGVRSLQARAPADLARPPVSSVAAAAKQVLRQLHVGTPQGRGLSPRHSQSPKQQFGSLSL